MRWIRCWRARYGPRISVRRQRKWAACGKHADDSGECPDQLARSPTPQHSHYATGYAGGEKRQTWRGL